MTVSGEVIKILDAICEKFGIVIDWTQQNIFPYLQELMGKIVSYELMTSIAWILIFTIPISMFFRYAIKIRKSNYCNALKTSHAETSVDEILYWICVVLSFIGVIVIVCQIFDIITCIAFPEKTVFDFLKSNNIIS